MKFPLQSSPFAPLKFSSEEKETFRRLAQSLLDQAIQEYLVKSSRGVTASYATSTSSDARALSASGYSISSDGSSNSGVGNASASAASASGSNHHHNSQDGKKSGSTSTKSHGDWKVVLKQESVTILKKQTKDPDDPATMVHLHAFGNISGTLDDVMYGLLARSPSSMRIRTSYVADNVVDSRVLYELDSPTVDTPFHFLGIQWLVKSSPPAFVKPRDLVVLKYFGVTTIQVPSPNDDARGAMVDQRIGFYILHSLDLRNVPPLEKSHGICRGKIFACHLFVENLNDPKKQEVDFFMQSKVDPSGSHKILSSIVTNSAANGMMSCFQAVYCAQMKKLAFYVNQRARQEKEWLHNTSDEELIGNVIKSASSKGGDASTKSQHQAGVAGTNCGCCHQSFSSLSSKYWCRICAQQICKRCVVTKRLSFDTSNRVIQQQKLRFCRGCITRSKAQSSFQLAQEEIRARGQEDRVSGSLVQVKSFESMSSSSSQDGGRENRNRTAKDDLTLLQAEDSKKLTSSGPASTTGIRSALRSANAGLHRSWSANQSLNQLKNHPNQLQDWQDTELSHRHSLEVLGRRVHEPFFAGDHDDEEDQENETHEDVEVSLDTSSMQKVRPAHPLVHPHSNGFSGAGGAASSASSAGGMMSRSTSSCSSSASVSCRSSAAGSQSTPTNCSSMEDMYVQISKLLQTTEKTREVLHQTNCQYIEDSGQYNARRIYNA